MEEKLSGRSTPSKGGQYRVHGYFFVFPIQKSCVDRIIKYNFEIGGLADTDIASRPEYGHALYIGGICAKGIRAKAELMGAAKTSVFSLASRTKGKLAYARAATARGYKILKDNEFGPVHPLADEVGAFYMKQIT